MLLFGAAESGKQPITTTDLLKIQRVMAVDVARDGSFAVYAVQSIHTQPPADAKGEAAYNYRTHLWYIDLGTAGAKPFQLTFGDRSDTSPSISPDGKMLAFARRDESTRERPKPQVWLLALHEPGEARQITRFEFGGGSPRWRPDGKALLAASSLPISKLDGRPPFDSERPGRSWFDWDRPSPNGDKSNDIPAEARPDGDRRSIRNWLEKNASRDNPTVVTRMNFEGEQAL